MIHDNVEFDFYFIRHGESISNITPGIAAGENFDALMTDRGHQQAEAAGRRLGEEGVKFYTRQKSIMQRWSDSIDAGAEFVMPTAK